MLKHFKKQYADDSQMDFDIEQVEDIIVNPDHCELKILGEANARTVDAPSRLVQNYCNRIEGVRDLKKELQDRPYDKATLDYINAKRSHLTAQCNAKANPTRQQELDVLTRLSELMSTT